MPLNSFNVGGLLRNFEAKEKVIKFSVGQKAWDYSDKCEIWYWFNCVRFGKPENLVREADWIRKLNSICVSGEMTVKKYNDKTITDVIAQGGGQWTWLSKNKSGYTLDYYEDESPAFWSITKDLWGNEIYSEKKPPSDSILKKYGF